LGEQNHIICSKLTKPPKEIAAYETITGLCFADSNVSGGIFLAQTDKDSKDSQAAMRQEMIPAPLRFASAPTVPAPRTNGKPGEGVSMFLLIFCSAMVLLLHPFQSSRSRVRNMAAVLREAL
jgi:hypothetical protein